MKQSYGKHRTRKAPKQVLPAPLVMNAFDISFDRPLSVPVILYEVRPVQPRNGTNGSAVNAMWRHRGSHRDCCSGSGFIVGVTDDVVATSQSWDLPSGEAAGFTIVRKMPVAVTPGCSNQKLVLAILQDAIKKHFKNADTDALGPLWRDYGDYCQMPPEGIESSLAFCRKFNVRPKFLSDQRLVIQIGVSTITLDGQTLSSYYERGSAEQVAELIDSSRERYSTRNGDPGRIRVWNDLRPDGRVDARVVEIETPEELIAHADLPPNQQRSIASSTVSCIEFPDKQFDLRLSHLRLIRGNWTTGGQHRQTILSPQQRSQLRDKVVDVLDGFVVHDCAASVSAEPVSATKFRTLNIVPPAIQVRSDWGQTRVIAAPDEFNADLLQRRYRNRRVAIGRNGFLRHSPVKPLLAWPRQVVVKRRDRQTIQQDLVEAMRGTLNTRFDERKIDACIESHIYSDVDELRQYVDANGFDALYAILPEPSGRTYQNDDTHELIKQRIGVPSQCMHYNNTLADHVALKPDDRLTDDDKEAVRRSIQQYDLCIDNLLVKCGWLPFMPAEPFRFNVHVGIDVGGRNNDTVMVSLCHGLADPSGEIVFRAQRIRVDVKQPEPIPSESLAMGIREIMDFVRTELSSAGLPANLEDVLFFRDGAMLGRDDRWNEKDGLNQLREALISDRVIDGSGVWAVAEAHKRGELWRVEGNRGGVHENPIVGQCIIGFERPDEALVCTTGQPFLRQGTAKPTIVRVHAIHGEIEIDSVLVDYIREADMGFTKFDVGHSLPWILRIADSGAQQLSREYKLSGITV